MQSVAIFGKDDKDILMNINKGHFLQRFLHGNRHSLFKTISKGHFLRIFFRETNTVSDCSNLYQRLAFYEYCFAGQQTQPDCSERGGRTSRGVRLPCC